MKINVKIECETVKELLAHLTVVRKDIKRLAKKYDYLDEELKPGKKLYYDDNCYGTHYVNITQYPK